MEVAARHDACRVCEREGGRARVKERPTGAVIRVLSVEKFGIRLLFITRAACREQNAPRAAKEVKVASRLQLCSMPQCVLLCVCSLHDCPNLARC